MGRRRKSVLALPQMSQRGGRREERQHQPVGFVAQRLQRPCAVPGMPPTHRHIESLCGHRWRRRDHDRADPGPHQEVDEGEEAEVAQEHIIYWIIKQLEQHCPCIRADVVPYSPMP